MFNIPTPVFDKDALTNGNFTATEKMASFGGNVKPGEKFWKTPISSITMARR